MIDPGSAAVDSAESLRARARWYLRMEYTIRQTLLTLANRTAGKPDFHSAITHRSGI